MVLTLLKSYILPTLLSSYPLPSPSHSHVPLPFSLRAVLFFLSSRLVLVNYHYGLCSSPFYPFILFVSYSFLLLIMCVLLCNIYFVNDMYTIFYRKCIVVVPHFERFKYDIFMYIFTNAFFSTAYVEICRLRNDSASSTTGLIGA